MPFLKSYRDDRREVAEAFQSGRPLRNNRTIRAEEKTAKADKRQRDHEQALGHRRAGRAR